ncbi:hypothetical protein LR48_Vigan13s000600 [Vigna angularis]|uniref:Uncharacterized protein n=1 Tax=Phaseolus angularis TaxID=3914 RepID=A0A0L9T2V8_PHAAN|nr:hypothetical protein LR48_Vigan13s000600 [Vigna angularis]
MVAVANSGPSMIYLPPQDPAKMSSGAARPVLPSHSNQDFSCFSSEQVVESIKSGAFCPLAVVESETPELKELRFEYSYAYCRLREGGQPDDQSCDNRVVGGLAPSALSYGAPGRERISFQISNKWELRGKLGNMLHNHNVRPLVWEKGGNGFCTRGSEVVAAKSVRDVKLRASRVARRPRCCKSCADGFKVLQRKSSRGFNLECSVLNWYSEVSILSVQSSCAILRFQS